MKLLLFKRKQVQEEEDNVNVEKNNTWKRKSFKNGTKCDLAWHEDTIFHILFI